MLGWGTYSGQFTYSITEVFYYITVVLIFVFYLLLVFTFYIFTSQGDRTYRREYPCSRVDHDTGVGVRYVLFIKEIYLMKDQRVNEGILRYRFVS